MTGYKLPDPVFVAKISELCVFVPALEWFKARSV